MVKILTAIGDRQPATEDINRQLTDLGPGWEVDRAFTLVERIEPKRHYGFCRPYQQVTITVVAKKSEI